MPDIAGLKLIVPTSVAGTGVSVSASGKVTFTSATTINVNGCFSATYDNYLVVFRAAASGGESLRYRLRASGTDATGSNYIYQRLNADGTSVAGARSASLDYSFMNYMDSTARNGMHTYFYGPFLSQPTASRVVTVSGYLGGYIQDDAATHSLSSSYDGFTFYLPTTNITGALCVYGLSQ